MMASGWWYVEALDGTRFAWSKAPAFRCELATFEQRDAGDGTFAERIVTTAPVEHAAAALQLQAGELAALLIRAHRSSGGERRRVDGRLTSDCAVCGRRMTRLGFRAWIDRPLRDDELTDSDRTSRRIAVRLGLDGRRLVLVREVYLATKREAESWARHELRRHRHNDKDTKL